MLGPVVFIIYINDITLELPASQLEMYANYSTEGASAKTLDVVEQQTEQ